MVDELVEEGWLLCDWLTLLREESELLSATTALYARGSQNRTKILTNFRLFIKIKIIKEKKLYYYQELLTFVGHICTFVAFK